MKSNTLNKISPSENVNPLPSRHVILVTNTLPSISGKVVFASPLGFS